jgi:hypothetical protein
MKNVFSIFMFSALVVGLVACKKSVNCETPVIKKVVFYTTISQQIVPDTTAELVKTKKASNFGLVSEIFQKIRLQKEDGYSKSMAFPLHGEEVYDYDWQITLRPSNRVYYLSNIKHESATSKTHHCTNTVTYLMNDSLVTVPGNPYSSTPNFVSDILIEYVQ